MLVAFAVPDGSATPYAKACARGPGMALRATLIQVSVFWRDFFAAVATPVFALVVGHYSACALGSGHLLRVAPAIAALQRLPDLGVIVTPAVRALPVFGVDVLDRQDQNHVA